MSELRNYTVQNVHINCPFDLAWDYLNEPLNQKEWGIHFYKDIKKVGNDYIASIPFGDIPFKIETSKNTGSIDLHFGGGEAVPSRLIKSSEHSCLYVFILFQPEPMPTIAWEKQGIPNMVEELELLKAILEQKALEL